MGGKFVTLKVLVVMIMVVKVASHNYGEALSKSILFFEGQRAGKLPSTQRMNWRDHSALDDGRDVGMDLVGGYYDAGDNVKFSFPMAFTTTMLAWSILEFGDLMGSDKQHALEALKWGTDYFLKATNVRGKVAAQVGDPIGDHNCWERPEDMDTPRTSYVVNTTKPGSEVSAEIAAALAASSMVFKSVDSSYSKWLLQRASQVYKFAQKYQGSYNFSVGKGVCPYYCDIDGYMDELIWGAAWLFKATRSKTYWNYVMQSKQNLDNFEFGWDAKYAGINVLVSKLVMNTPDADPFVSNAEKFVCSVLPESPTKSVSYSPGGLLFKPGGSNTQHVTGISFLLLVYSNYMKMANNRVLHCGNNASTPPSRLVDVAKSQVDYILGSNPMKMSYMVGYGKKFPVRIHHRASSMPSIHSYRRHIACKGGSFFYESKYHNFNVLTGAIVGGPDENDRYVDNRNNASQSEPTTYINAPFVGVLAYFKSYPSLGIHI